MLLQTFQLSGESRNPSSVCSLLHCILICSKPVLLTVMHPCCHCLQIGACCPPGPKPLAPPCTGCPKHSQSLCSVAALGMGQLCSLVGTGASASRPYTQASQHDCCTGLLLAAALAANGATQLFSQGPHNHHGICLCNIKSQGTALCKPTGTLLGMTQTPQSPAASTSQRPPSSQWAGATGTRVTPVRSACSRPLAPSVTQQPQCNGTRSAQTCRVSPAPPSRLGA